MTTIKEGLKYAFAENVAIIILSLFSLATLLYAAYYAPKPVTFASLKAIHDANIRQHIYLLLMFYLIIYGISTISKNKRFLNYSASVVCYKHIFASVILITCCTVQFLSFCFFKNAIPYINPYKWDSFFIKLDWILLFKNHPWSIIKDLIPSFEMIAVYDYIYLSWIPVTSIMLFWQQVTTHRELRIQYLTSLLAVWLVLGCWFAAAFASVGPCFYTAIYSESPNIIKIINSHIDPLSKNLGLLTASAKQALLSNYINQEFIIGYGISAFPSLHVATTTINALTLIRRFKKMTFIVWLYLIALCLSCIYIGFHYLADCIFGMLGAFVIWRLTAKLYKSFWYKKLRQKLI